MWYDENLNTDKDAEISDRQKNDKIQSAVLSDHSEEKTKSPDILPDFLKAITYGPQVSVEDGFPVVEDVLDESADLPELTLEELLEAELTSSAVEEPNAHMAILAAFENSLKVETVARDVGEVCEEIKDLAESKPIPMPECTKWEGVEPVSRFGMGGTVDNSGKGGSNTFVSGFINARPMLLSGTVLAFAMVAVIGYSGPEAVLKFAIDIIPVAPERARAFENLAKKSLKASEKKTLATNATRVMTASGRSIVAGKSVAGETGKTKAMNNRLMPDETFEAGISTHQQGGVTIVKKMPELAVLPGAGALKAKPDTKLQPSYQIASTGLVRQRTGEVETYASQALSLIEPEKLPEMFPDGDKSIQEPGQEASVIEKLKAALPPVKTGVEPRLVKIVSITRKLPGSVKGRSKESVELAMLHAKAGFSLSEEQKRQLVPKLVNGACVAVSLQQVAGRVSPVLMRDLLARLKSDC